MALRDILKFIQEKPEISADREVADTSITTTPSKCSADSSITTTPSKSSADSSITTTPSK